MDRVELNISEIIIQHPEINSFDELLSTIRNFKSDNVVFLKFDIKPDYRDTPRDWQWQVESAFSSIR